MEVYLPYETPTGPQLEVLGEVETKLPQPVQRRAVLHDVVSSRHAAAIPSLYICSRADPQSASAHAAYLARLFNAEGAVLAHGAKPPRKSRLSHCTQKRLRAQAFSLRPQVFCRIRP